MPSPFPGMDPYLESQGHWADFHSTFIHVARNAIVARLPADYVARIEERLYLVDVPGGTGPHFIPDVTLARVGKTRPVRAAAPRGVATLEPVVLAYQPALRESVRERWIEIRRRPAWEVVAAIEVLSPTNKPTDGGGRSAYLEKRQGLLDRPVHLVELDLLLGGAPGRRWPNRTLPAITSRPSRGRKIARFAKSMAGRFARACRRSRYP